MALQFSVAFRNAMLDQFETVIGASPVLEIRSGAPPTNCAAADAGTLLASLALPADWMAAASGGTKALAGTWTDAAADATGLAAHYRIKQGATCHHQGTITASGGGGDMIIDNVSIAAGQPVNVIGFTLTAPGA